MFLSPKNAAKMIQNMPTNTRAFAIRSFLTLQASFFDGYLIFVLDIHLATEGFGKACRSGIGADFFFQFCLAGLVTGLFKSYRGTRFGLFAFALCYDALPPYWSSVYMCPRSL